jgi:hypothetical protein
LEDESSRESPLEAALFDSHVLPSGKPLRNSEDIDADELSGNITANASPVTSPSSFIYLLAPLEEDLHAVEVYVNQSCSHMRGLINDLKRWSSAEAQSVGGRDRSPHEDALGIDEDIESSADIEMRKIGVDAPVVPGPAAMGGRDFPKDSTAKMLLQGRYVRQRARTSSFSVLNKPDSIIRLRDRDRDINRGIGIYRDRDKYRDIDPPRESEQESVAMTARYYQDAVTKLYSKHRTLIAHLQVLCLL